MSGGSALEAGTGEFDGSQQESGGQESGSESGTEQSTGGQEGGTESGTESGTGSQEGGTEGGSESGTESGGGTQESGTEGESESGGGGTEGGTEQGTGGQTPGEGEPTLLGIPGVTPTEESQIINEAFQIEYTINNASPAQQALFRLIIEQNPGSTYLIPSAQWIDTMVYATQGLTEDQLEAAAQLDWTPGNVSREDLRAQVQAAIEQAQTPPESDETEGERTNLAEDPLFLRAIIIRDEETGRFSVDQTMINNLLNPEWRVPLQGGSVSVSVTSLDAGIEAGNLDDTPIQIGHLSLEVHVEAAAPDSGYSVGDTFHYEYPRFVYNPESRAFLGEVSTPVYGAPAQALVQISEGTIALRPGIQGTIQNLEAFSATIIQLENVRVSGEPGSQTASAMVAVDITEIHQATNATRMQSGGNITSLQVGERVNIPVELSIP
mgnify:CR=1 FL=1